MKRWFFCMLVLIAVVCMPAWAVQEQSKAQGDICLNYVRLHVLAEDDSDAAQALKLKVRDACLVAAQELLVDCESADQAWEMLHDNEDIIQGAAQLRARECGFEGDVATELGVFAFPDRTYGDVVVPAGDYRALRVVLGEGEGKNWWCVLYPSLCMPEDFQPDTSVQFYSSIGQWIQSMFGGSEA